MGGLRREFYDMLGDEIKKEPNNLFKNIIGN